MGGLNYIDDSNILVRESLMNFEVDQMVSKRGEDKSWMIVVIKGKQIKVMDGWGSVRWFLYWELETLTAPLDIPAARSRRKWSEDEKHALISDPVNYVLNAAKMGRSAKSAKEKLARLRKEKKI